MAQLERRLELWKSKGNSESTDLVEGVFQVKIKKTVDQIVGKTFSKALVSKSVILHIVYLASGHPCSQVTKREGSDSRGVFPRVPQTADQIVFTPGFALLCPLLLFTTHFSSAFHCSAVAMLCCEGARYWNDRPQLSWSSVMVARSAVTHTLACFHITLDQFKTMGFTHRWEAGL